MTEPTKAVLLNTVKEWTKFTTERDKLTAVANEVAQFARKAIQECLMVMKAQNVDVQCDSPDAMKILGVNVVAEPMVEAAFPNVKASVILKCAGATRAIVINPNLSISAGGTPILLDQLKKAVPEPFILNAAEFVRDAFLNVARTGGKEQ
ncbi:MAG TPA: hypothetical protein VNN76_06080 [Bacteroidota bacterium]|nr:hypothetical protein [Bacteroidota bacterium]